MHLTIAIARNMKEYFVNENLPAEDVFRLCFSVCFILGKMLAKNEQVSFREETSLKEVDSCIRCHDIASKLLQRNHNFGAKRNVAGTFE